MYPSPAQRGPAGCCPRCLRASWLGGALPFSLRQQPARGRQTRGHGSAGQQGQAGVGRGRRRLTPHPPVGGLAWLAITSALPPTCSLPPPHQVPPSLAHLHQDRHYRALRVLPDGHLYLLGWAGQGRRRRDRGGSSSRRRWRRRHGGRRWHEHRRCRGCWCCCCRGGQDGCSRQGGGRGGWRLCCCSRCRRGSGRSCVRHGLQARSRSVGRSALAATNVAFHR